MSADAGYSVGVIERVCVVGAGVIGSLFAAHLSRVADVWVLTRRGEHARALAADGLTVTGRAEFTGAVHATDDPAELPEIDVAIVATKATGLDAAARALEGRSPGRSWSPSRTGSARSRSCAATATGRSCPASPS